MTNWVGVVLALLKLINTILSDAARRRAEGVGRAVAIKEATERVQQMVDKGEAVRNGTLRHLDAHPAELRNTDGHRRD